MIHKKIDVPIAGGLNFPLQSMVRVEQKFSAPKIGDIKATIKNEFAKEAIRNKIKRGQKIAVGCGSRGIANIAIITKSVIHELISLGAEPFIFPCMGSHGAASAEGQKEVLAGYGISEETMSVPVHATMATEIVGHLEDGTPVHVDKNASHADGIVVINAIGIGKINGAATYHRHGMDMFPSLLPKIRDVNIKQRNVLFGIGIVENAFDQTAVIEIIPAEQIADKEPDLQRLAKENMPKLNFSRIDVLIIDEMGKNISGAGFDPNITGRNRRAVAWSHALDVKKIVVLRLTPESHGNATGIGGADVITMQLYRDMDVGATYANVATSMNLDGAAIPIIMNSDRDAIALAIKTVVRTTPENCRVVRIKNTLSLGEIYVSQNMVEEIKNNPDQFTIMSNAKNLQFDSENKIQPFD